MRRVLWIGVGVLLLTSAACNHTRLGLFSREPREPVAKGPPPTTADLVTYLNANSSRLQSLRCDSIDLTASQGPLLGIGLQGKMICQQPRNFLLRAGVGGATELDLGSNNEEFWWWIKKAEPPAQVHCSYKDLEEGRVRHMPFPFQPDWVMETLGMATYGPPEKFQLKDEGQKLKLVQVVRSPQGKTVYKVIVMNRSPVLPPTPQVTDYLLLDEGGREICSAHISQNQMDPVKGGLYPKRMELRWPEQRVRLALELKSSTANVDIPPNFEAFVRRPLAGIPCYNLATGRPDGQPSALQRAAYDRR
jgi:hypothetical protein